MAGLGMSELIIIFLIVMLLFGASKLPALGEGMGKALKSLKDATKDDPPPPQKTDAPKPPDAAAR
jgi:sec-independent protein translocase protein TatA